MRDLRDNDLRRKLSQIRGTSVHTFEYDVHGRENLVRETTIRCVIKLMDDQNREKYLDKQSSELRKNVQIRSIYELYSTLEVVFDCTKTEVQIINLETDENALELIRNTDFMTSVENIQPNWEISQALLIKLGKNTIKGLPREYTEVTMVLSFINKPEVIEISD